MSRTPSRNLETGRRGAGALESGGDGLAPVLGLAVEAGACARPGGWVDGGGGVGEVGVGPGRPADAVAVEARE